MKQKKTVDDLLQQLKKRLDEMEEKLNNINNIDNKNEKLDQLVIFFDTFNKEFGNANKSK